MNKPRLESRGGVALDDGKVAEFRGAFAGDVILPGDAGYDGARRIWNASIDRYPGMIARCVGAADVAHAVKFARANDLVVAVRGGGHNVGGRALCDRGLVIDLSVMRGVLVDPDRRTARVQGGATLADVDRETHRFGLAVPLGVVSRTGVGGLTLGGGVGWLVRKYGLTCDNVLSFEVVTAEGHTLTASAEENPDLFWALRGGGGNFGVVTSFLYRAHPVSTVLGGLIVHARDQAGPVLRHYRSVMASAPDELTAYAGLVTTPDGVPAVAVIACHCGEETEAERAMRPLREFGQPLLDAIQRMPLPAMQQLLDEAFPDRAYNYWKSTFVRELSDDAVDLLVEHANRARSPLSAVVVELYGGAADRVGDAETAFAQRRAGYDIGIMAQWTDPSEADEHTAWARGLSEALRPHASGGYLLNFLGEEGEDTVRRAFGGNYARLVELKRRYDPTNFFRLNQNIRPAV
jgi:FAD/FMN-containing dehydrogenase